MQWLRGDPNLTCWEERFLADTGRMAHDAINVLSRKQAAIVIERRDRFGYTSNAPVIVPPESIDDAVDDDDDAETPTARPFPERAFYRVSIVEQVVSEDALERAVQRMANDYSEDELRRLRCNRFLKDLAPARPDALATELVA